MLIYITAFIIFIWQDNLCHSLRITKVTVPTPMIVGDSGILDCQWTSEDMSVYSLKWYLGLHEFYRWTPAVAPKIQIFPIEEAFHIDENKSDEGKVSIQNVTLSATGLLRCEISGEAPKFHTDHEDVKLIIIDTPDSRPVIRRGQIMNKYPYETVFVNCTSRNAKPAANLSFFVNEEKADESWVYRYPVYIDERTELETSVIGLELPLLPRFRRRGYVAVKCVAEQLKIYWESSEVVVAGEMPQRASIMEGRASRGMLNMDNSFLLTRSIILLICFIFH